MTPRVRIEFDCLPMRSLGRLDVPLDAPPELEAKAEQVKAAASQAWAAQYVLPATRPARSG